MCRVQLWGVLCVSEEEWQQCWGGVWYNIQAQPMPSETAEARRLGVLPTVPRTASGVAAHMMASRTWLGLAVGLVCM